jgi:hypothetical protein
MKPKTAADEERHEIQRARFRLAQHLAGIKPHPSPFSGILRHKDYLHQILHGHDCRAWGRGVDGRACPYHGDEGARVLLNPVQGELFS